MLSRTACFLTGSLSGRAQERSARKVADLYGPFGLSRAIVTDVTSAELIKYASNAYLATRLTFVNSMAELCEAAGADIRSVMAGMGSDHRIGNAFLQPGPGWGGSCFPKDTQALVHTAEQSGCGLALVKTAITENARHIQRVVDKVAAALGDVCGKRIALWGLAFKAGTGDLRNSPALEIAQRLIALGASVQAYDPAVPAGVLHGMEVHSSSMSACQDADALVIGTEWPEFASVDFSALCVVMRGRVIVDARNMLDPVAAAAERASPTPGSESEAADAYRGGRSMRDLGDRRRWLPRVSSVPGTPGPRGRGCRRRQLCDEQQECGSSAWHRVPRFYLHRR